MKYLCEEKQNCCLLQQNEKGGTNSYKRELWKIEQNKDSNNKTLDIVPENKARMETGGRVPETSELAIDSARELWVIFQRHKKAHRLQFWNANKGQKSQNCPLN